MFSLFKKKSELEVLNKKYQKLQKEAFELSTIDRQKSDMKQTEAHEILNQIQKIKANS